MGTLTNLDETASLVAFSIRPILMEVMYVSIGSCRSIRVR
jgi:hypothetical protein